MINNERAAGERSSAALFLPVEQTGGFLACVVAAALFLFQRDQTGLILLYALL